MEMKDLIMNGHEKTIINTSSNILLTVKNFDLQLLEKPMKFKKLFGTYAFSKLALSLWTKELSETMEIEGIEVRSACPGGNRTKMTSSDGMPFVLKLLAKFAFSHPSKGAQKLYDAYASFKGVTGKFIKDGRITPIKFPENSKLIINRIDHIYKTEF